MITVSQLRNASSMAEEGKRLARIGVALFVFGGVPGAPILSYLLLARPRIDPLLAQILASPAIFAIDGLFALLPVGVILWLFAGLSPARKVVNHFYDSLAKEDYLTAFHYLDPDMRIPKGQQITPMWFTRRALIAESAGGLVTDYSVLRFDVQSKERYFTLKVTRGERLYTTRLRLRKQGGNWKIMGFDRL